MAGAVGRRSPPPTRAARAANLIYTQVDEAVIEYSDTMRRLPAGPPVSFLKSRKQVQKALYTAEILQLQAQLDELEAQAEDAAAIASDLSILQAEDVD